MPQRPDELASLLKLMRKEGVRRYLEIGLRRGATFEAVGSTLPPESLLVGVDWPMRTGGRWKPEEQEALYGAVRRLKRHHSVSIVEGNSRDPATVAAVAELGPFDCILIDGDHSDLGVRSDWENYGHLSRIVAFHDIDTANHAQAKPRKVQRWGVRKLWDELRSEGYRNVEIIGKERGMGTGVLWREAYQN